MEKEHEGARCPANETETSKKAYEGVDAFSDYLDLMVKRSQEKAEQCFSCDKLSSCHSPLMSEKGELPLSRVFIWMVYDACQRLEDLMKIRAKKVLREVFDKDSEKNMNFVLNKLGKK